MLQAAWPPPGCTQRGPARRLHGHCSARVVDCVAGATLRARWGATATSCGAAHPPRLQLIHSTLLRFLPHAIKRPIEAAWEQSNYGAAATPAGGIPNDPGAATAALLASEAAVAEDVAGHQSGWPDPCRQGSALAVIPPRAPLLSVHASWPVLGCVCASRAGLVSSPF